MYLTRLFIAAFIFTVSCHSILAQVSVSPYHDAKCDGIMVNVTTINISETSTNDFALTTGVGETMVFTPTSGTFTPGVGTVSFDTPDVTATINVTTNDFTITLTAASAAHASDMNNLQISGLEFHNTIVENVEIRYNSGTASVNGLTTDQPVAVAEINPLPFGGNDALTICEGNLPGYDLQSNVNIFGNAESSTFSWSTDFNPNVSGASPSGSDSYLNDYLFTLTGSPQVVSYHVTPTSTFGCIGPEFVVQITVNEAPLSLFTKSSLFPHECIGNVVTYTAAAGKTNYTWNVTNGAITAGGTTSDNTVTVQWPALAGSGQVDLYFTNASGCTSSPFGMSVTIDDSGPTAPNVTGTTVCSGLQAYFDIQQHVYNNGNGISGFYDYVAADNPSTTGEPLTPTASSFIQDAVVNSAGSAQNIVYTVSGHNSLSNCPGVPFDITIAVDPQPIGGDDLPPAICSGISPGYSLVNNVNTLGNGVPSNFSWSAIPDTQISGASGNSGNTVGDVLDNNSTAPHNVVYTVTPTSVNGCTGSNFTVTIAVNPPPMVTSALASACLGAPATFNASNPAGTFVWSASGSNTYTGGSAADNFIDVTWTTGTTESVTCNYTNSYGCSGLATLNNIALVNGTPIGTDPTPTVCSNSNLALDLDLSVSTPALFSWVAADNSLTTGESLTPQPGNLMEEFIGNITANPQQVTYTVTPTGACGVGTNFQVTVTVNPEPFGITDNKTSCASQSVNYDLQSNVNAGNGLTSTFSWIAADNPNVEGETHISPASGSTINNFINFSSAGSATELIVYTVTPTSSASCTGQPFIVNVTLARPPFAPSLSPATCSNIPVNVDLQAHVDAQGNDVPSTFSWLATDNTNTSGESLSAQNSGIITDVVSNNTSFKQFVMYTVTPSSITGACAGSAFTVTLSVNEAPTAINSTSTVCSGVAQNFDINAHYIATGNGVLSTTFSWVATDNANTTGETTTPQSTTSISDIIINAGTAQENIVYTITPSGGTTNCAGTPFTLTATVNPLPATFSTNNKPTISSTGSTDITLSSPVAGATFAYTVIAPPEISGTSAGSGGNIIQVLTNANTLQHIVTYTITATANACSGTPVNVNVTVNGDPTMSSADSLALVALYNALNGSAWTQKTNWLTGAAYTWYGVSTSSERLTSLALPNNNLTGALPVGFFDLSQMSLLDLKDNHINSSLPVEVSNFGSLQILDIRNNDLSGALPSTLYSMTGLTQLFISGNQFTGGLQSSISNLTNLVTLQAEHLPMTGTIPPEVFGLTGLLNLGLSGKLNGPLPSAIGSLTGLMTFTCDSCAITSLPAQIGTLNNLASLRLHNNKLTVLPSLTGAPLTYLDVAKNNLTFESLEPNITLATFVYAPQDSTGIATTTLIQTGTPYNLSAAVGGSSNQYIWKKNNVVIAGQTGNTLAFSSPAFADEGTYIAEVTNTSVPGLTIVKRPVVIHVSSLQRDSLSLVQIYNATNGASWTNKLNWLTGNLAAWNGVVISGNRVTALNLPANNVSGALPVALTDMLSLNNANLSGNKITSIPSIAGMTGLTNLNIANNKITFGSLEPNVAQLSKLTYSPQANLGTITIDSVAAGTPFNLVVTTDGVNTAYQWKHNATAIGGATQNEFPVGALSRQTMGTYQCDITNSVVPGLTLHSETQTLVAVANLSGKLLSEPNTGATKGKVTLLRVVPNNAFDTVKVKAVGNDGTFAFNKILLADYQLFGFADRSTYARALPTYYKQSLFWEEADTLFVNGNLENLDIVSQLEPLPPSGRGSISGFVEEDDGTGTGRTKKPKRVAGAGVSARRVESTGRGKGEVLVLVAYVFTDANGDFTITNLPEGQYRLNIQYPGYPMNENSFVTFGIGTGLASEVKVEAFVAQGVINVNQLIITGVWNKEGYSAEVYPNPTSSWIQMNFACPSSYRVIGIFDVAGKQITKVNATEQHLAIDVSSYKKGSYLLNVTEKGELVKTLHVIIE